MYWRFQPTAVLGFIQAYSQSHYFAGGGGVVARQLFGGKKTNLGGSCFLNTHIVKLLLLKWRLLDFWEAKNNFGGR